MEKISYEIAQQEVNKWLDARRVSVSKRESQEAAISSLIEAVMYGQIVIDENNQITQILTYPIGENDSFTKLTYKTRITQGEVSTRISALKNSDSLSVISAYVSALTTQPLSLLQKLDTTDYSLCQTIAVFFI